VKNKNIGIILLRTVRRHPISNRHAYTLPLRVGSYDVTRDFKDFVTQKLFNAEKYYWYHFFSLIFCDFLNKSQFLVFYGPLMVITYNIIYYVKNIDHGIIILCL